MNYDSVRKKICKGCEEMETCSMSNPQIDICLRLKYSLEWR